MAAITQDIVLENDWRRYEMNVEGIDLIGVTYPFAFIVNKGQDLGTVVFSLKGVTYDSKVATDPHPLQEIANDTSFPTTTILATTESNILMEIITLIVRDVLLMRVKNPMEMVQLLIIRVMIWDQISQRRFYR